MAMAPAQEYSMTNKDKKILFILTYYYPHWTGLTQYARRLAEALAGKEYAVSVLTVKHNAELAANEVISEVTVQRKPALFRFSRTFISPAFVFSFWQQIRNSDTIFVYLPFAEILLVVLIAKLFRKRLYLVHNGDLVLPKGLLKRFLELCYFYTTDWSIKLATAIIIQTDDYAKHSQLLLRNKNKWQVILPLYDPLSFDKQIAMRLREKLLPHKSLTIGFAGRFVEEKGFDILLKALPRVIEKLPQAQFIFAGDTHITYEDFFVKQKHVIEQFKQHLVLLGTLNNSEMAEFYRLCDVFVVSSRTDCFPSTEVEALLAGTPVVVTDIPGARWPMQQTHMGTVVAAQNPDALAEGIVSVLRNKRKYIRSTETVAAVFDNKKALRKYEELL